MFTLDHYFGYMIQKTLDPDFNGNFFMENTHHRGTYYQYFPAYIKALERHLKNDFDILEGLAILTPSWEKPIQELKANREKYYRSCEIICEKIKVSNTVKDMFHDDILYEYAALFIAEYINNNKDTSVTDDF
jgi:hypothetical protein